MRPGKVRDGRSALRQASRSGWPKVTQRRPDDGWHRKTNDVAAQARKREYNSAEYKQARAAAKRIVDAGQGFCWRCGRWLDPRRSWHLGHDDHDRTIIRGPECVPCNLGAAARKGAQVANARRRRTSESAGSRAVGARSVRTNRPNLEL